MERLKAMVVALVGSMKSPTWAPIWGGATLIGATVLRLVGKGDVANLLLTFGGVLGLTDQSPFTLAEVGSVAAQLMGSVTLTWGIWRKLVSARQRAAAPPLPAA